MFLENLSFLKDLGLLFETLALTGVASNAIKEGSTSVKSTAFKTCDCITV